MFNLQKWIHLKNNESDQNWRILGSKMGWGKVKSVISIIIMNLNLYALLNKYCFTHYSGDLSFNVLKSNKFLSCQFKDKQDTLSNYYQFKFLSRFIIVFIPLCIFIAKIKQTANAIICACIFVNEFT